LEGLREIGVIFGAEFWRTLRSVRVVVLLVLYLMFTGMVFLGFRWGANKVEEQVDKQVEQLKENGVPEEEIREKLKEVTDKSRREFISSVFGNDDEAMTEALLVMPLVVLVVFKISLFFLPVYVAIMGFDQIAGEVGPRSIRYLTVRSRRSSVMFGKYLAQGAVLALLMLLVDAGLVFYGKAAYADFGFAAASTTLAKLWLSAVVFSAAYLALTTLCSSLFRQPAVSLVMNFVVLFAIWLVSAIAEAVPLPDPVTFGWSLFGYVRYASVWHYRGDLLHPHFGRLAGAGGAHVLFTLLFLGVGYAILRRRDL
jgi:ABC-2 type transport system permease protein